MIDSETVGAEWLDLLAGDLGTPPRSAEVAEVLSDTSAEPYLNALAARHLRAFGRRRRGSRFWVRSEWGKTDICYGVASGTFVSWDDAWQLGVTGDLGQIEAKLLYAHYTRAQRAERLGKLASQLDARARKDRKLRDAAHAAAQSYHGLVWLFAHGSDTSSPDDASKEVLDAQASVLSEARDLGLPAPKQARGQPFRSVFTENLGDLWPNVTGNYIGRLSVALLGPD